jgi:hypothetical protein
LAVSSNAWAPERRFPVRLTSGVRRSDAAGGAPAAASGVRRRPTEGAATAAARGAGRSGVPRGSGRDAADGQSGVPRGSGRDAAEGQSGGRSGVAR